MKKRNNDTILKEKIKLKYPKSNRETYSIRLDKEEYKKFKNIIKIQYGITSSDMISHLIDMYNNYNKGEL